MPWPFAAFTAVYACYQVISLPVNFAGRGFDLAAHQARLARWHPGAYPSVDIYLPDLRRAGRGAAQHLGRGGGAGGGLPRARRGPTSWTTGRRRRPAGTRRPSGSPTCAAPACASTRRAATCGTPSRARTASSSSSWTPTSRRARTCSARRCRTSTTPASPSSRPRSSSAAAPAQTWVENAAGAIQEVFYRSVQVARDRFGAAICVGTSAVYRRAALAAEGGPTLIPYAEDVHTGLDVRRAGWSVVYLPVVLSVGICPDNLDAFVRQQYRWCTGNVGVVFSAGCGRSRCRCRPG